MRACELELDAGRGWEPVAELRLRGAPELGIRAATDFEYEVDWSLKQLSGRGLVAVSVHLPVSFELVEHEAWPPFLVDLLPSGAARHRLEAQLGLRNDSSADGELLLRGAGNPPGNLRVASAAVEPQPGEGFPEAEVCARGEGFVEYAASRGLPLTGSSGAGGESPKLLLRQDEDGRWHGDGDLEDARTAGCWLIKFPRSSRDKDRLILEAEAPYMALAAALGAQVFGELRWAEDVLFVPRFDRRRDGAAVRRLGLESLCSAAGVVAFGASIPKEELVRVVMRFSDDGRADALEMLRRDVLDVAFGNTDNHSRNTALLKGEDGGVRLAPLFDFAPMILAGTARVCRWGPERERGGKPDWGAVARFYEEELGLPEAWAVLRDLSAAMPELAALEGAGVPAGVLAEVASRYEEQRAALARCDDAT